MAEQIGNLLRPEDALFHRPFEGEWRWAETNWFSFLVPEIPLRGHMMQLFRTGLGVVRSQVFVYTGESTRHILGWEFCRDDYHMPYEGDLDHFELPNGLEVEMTRPFEHWKIRYDSKLDTHWELELDALMPPVCSLETRIDTAGAGFSVFHRNDPDAPMKTGHIDQTHHVTGEATINGKRYQVDYPSAHDHSWSPRREFGHNIIGNFDEAHFGKEVTLSVQTRNDAPNVGIVTNGYVLDHGEVYALKGGEGRYEMDGFITKAVDYEIEDARGKTWRMHGDILSICEHHTVNSLATCALVKWTMGGEAGWGECKWHWDIQRMQAALRTGEFGWTRDLIS